MAASRLIFSASSAALARTPFDFLLDLDDAAGGVLPLQGKDDHDRQQDDDNGDAGVNIDWNVHDCHLLIRSEETIDMEGGETSHMRRDGPCGGRAPVRGSRGPSSRESPAAPRRRGSASSMYVRITGPELRSDFSQALVCIFIF